MDIKSIRKRHAICDAHFPDNMFTLNLSKELSDWAIPMKPETNDDTYAVEYINCGDDEEPTSEIYLEIQAVQAVKELEYSCDICEKKFESRAARNTHIDNHFKTYDCETCGQSFVGDRQYEHHRISNKCIPKQHINSETYECYVCHKANFFTIRSLRVHFNRLHARMQCKSNQHVCEHCEKTFVNPYILKSHIKQIHLQLVSFVCADCGKVFNRNSNLKWHQLIHQNKLPCTCKICGKAFRTLSGLNLHKRTHTGEKPYKCHLCEKAYAYNTDLKRHKRTHGIIDKEFHCSKCTQIFYEPKFLRRHMQRVHE